MADNDTFWAVSDDSLFDEQQVVTPDYSSLKTSGVNKLLVVVFVVDCSDTMKGERIMAVNAALAEIWVVLRNIKNANGLDLKVAIMSFTSSTRWELQLANVDEVSFENLKVRPGLTEYGNAFHELNKVLREDRFLKHSGKKAPPAIMFLTDGRPSGDYESDLEELLNNEFFAGASRSVVLLGDAIHDDVARNAVKRFVKDPDKDIVDADNSAVIIQKVKLATMHAVADEPIKGNNNNGNGTSPSDSNNDKDNPFKNFDKDDPFGNSGNDDPFGNSGNDDPFGNSGNDDPFGNSGNDDLFGNSGNDDPFGNSGNDDPFGNSGNGDPFSSL